MQPLTQEELNQALAKLEHWEVRDGWLLTAFEFSDFLEAIDFVGAVAEAAEKHQHHPNILIEYDVVTLELRTHDADGITQKDIDLAHALDHISLDYDQGPVDPGFY